jgi:hypothetical protein
VNSFTALPIHLPLISGRVARRSLKAVRRRFDGSRRQDLGSSRQWDTITFDPEFNMVYIGTGNGSPWNRKIRSPSGGDNLYLASIVALNADTGKYIWHYQETPGDNWDYTSTQPMILADIKIDGAPRKVNPSSPSTEMSRGTGKRATSMIGPASTCSTMMWTVAPNSVARW